MNAADPVEPTHVALVKRLRLLLHFGEWGGWRIDCSPEELQKIETLLNLLEGPRPKAPEPAVELDLTVAPTAVVRLERLQFQPDREGCFDDPGHVFLRRPDFRGTIDFRTTGAEMDRLSTMITHRGYVGLVPLDADGKPIAGGGS